MAWPGCRVPAMGLTPGEAEDEGGAGGAGDAAAEVDDAGGDGGESSTEEIDRDPPEQEVHESRASPLQQRIIEFEKDRDAGMAAWKAGDAAKAVEHWSMARGSLKYVVDKDLLKDDPPALAQVKEDHYKMHLNLAQGFLKTEEWRQVIEYAGRALTYDPNSEKALYRTCLAWKEIGHFDDARTWLARLIKAHPNNAAGKQMLQEIARREEAAKKTAKKSAAKIFEGLRNEHDHRVEKSTWEKVRQAPRDIAQEMRNIVSDARQWLEDEKAACSRRCRRRKAD